MSNCIKLSETTASTVSLSTFFQAKMEFGPMVFKEIIYTKIPAKINCKPIFSRKNTIIANAKENYQKGKLKFENFKFQIGCGCDSFNKRGRKKNNNNNKWNLK